VKRFWKHATCRNWTSTTSPSASRIGLRCSGASGSWSTRPGRQSVTRADAKKADARTYAYCHAANMLDMSYDDRGNLNWSGVETPDDEDPIESSGRFSSVTPWTAVQPALPHQEARTGTNSPLRWTPIEHNLGVVVIAADNVTSDELYTSPAMIAT